jgi:hypothetical protein
LIHRKVTMIRLLPLVAGLQLSLLTLNAAWGQAMAPEQVAQLLAKSNAVNLKCKILSEDAAQELRGLVARAEISLAEKVSVDAARKAMSSGREQGKAIVCDQAASKLVNDVLKAGQRAMSVDVADETSVEGEKPKAAPIVAAEEEADTAPEPDMPAMAATEQPESAPEKPAVAAATKAVAVTDAPVAVDAAKPEAEPVVQDAVKEEAKVAEKEVAKPKPTKLAKKAAAKTTQKAKPPIAKKTVARVVKAPVAKPKTQNLGSYGALAERYYVARRCKNMSNRQIGALYNRVLVSHRQAMNKNKARDVRAVLRSAEARAGGQGC